MKINKLTNEGLIKVIKLGAKLNNCECIGDEIINELAHTLDLPFALSKEYIKNISKIVTTLSTDHRTKNSYSKSKFRNRRQALVIDTNARIVNYEAPKAIQETPETKNVDEKSKKKAHFIWCINTRIRYSFVNLILAIVSIVLFILYALVASFHPMYDMFGVGILFSRGAALSILIFTMLAMFFVSYDVTTWLRKKLRGKLTTLFDFQILFHRF